MLTEYPFQGPLPFDPVLLTDHRIAYESPDHLHPLGTMQDNSRNPRFNQKIFDLFQDKPLKILDIGCSGGGFVKDMVDAGHFAIGLEGSDYSQRHKRAEWATIPGNLTTCDVVKPFDILAEEGGKRGERIKFDLITAWEVLEHLHEKDLGQFLENIGNHLDPERGIFMASVAFFSSMHDGVELHQTMQPDPWWIDRIERAGFRLLEPALVYLHLDWIRGPLQGSGIECFHVVFGHPSCRKLDGRLLELITRDSRQIYRDTYEYIGGLTRLQQGVNPIVTELIETKKLLLKVAQENDVLKRKLLSSRERQMPQA